MDEQAEQRKEMARMGRLISIVIAATMILWMLAQWVGARLGLPSEYVYLFDLFALAGCSWALIVTYQLWRKRREIERD